MSKLELRKEYRNLSEDELIDRAKENARENIKEFTGQSCFSVFKAIYDLIETSIPYESVKMLSGFNLGFGFTGNICGALSGGMAALGLVHGITEPEPINRKFSEIIKNEEMTSEEKVEKAYPFLKKSHLQPVS